MAKTKKDESEFCGLLEPLPDEAARKAAFKPNAFEKVFGCSNEETIEEVEEDVAETKNLDEVADEPTPSCFAISIKCGKMGSLKIG